MALDLGDLIEDLQNEVNTPGVDSFPESTDDDWLSSLRNGFWEARLGGLLEGYTELDGEVTTDDGGADMPRDLQHIIIFFASYIIIRNTLRTMGTLFRAQAGPVEYETQNSAQVLKELLADYIYRRNLLLATLSDYGSVTPAYVDAVISRNTSIGYGTTWFIG